MSALTLSNHEVVYRTFIEEEYLSLMPFIKGHKIVQEISENDVLITSRNTDRSSKKILVTPRNAENLKTE